MKPYEWMVEYTPQTLWIEKKGVLILLAEVTGILGGGLYLVSLYFASQWGMQVAWLIIALLKGPLHFAHLGQPRRFWRLARKPGSSWLARGFIFMALFLVFGAAQLLCSYLLPGTVGEQLLKVPTGIAAFLVIGYSGFLMNYVRGIPLWNSGLLPLLFVMAGLTGGLSLLLLFGTYGYGSVDSRVILTGLRWVLCTDTVFIATYLWSAASGSSTGEHSVKELTRGRTALVLWLGIFLCGIGLPLGISLYDYYVGQPAALWLAAASLGALTGIVSLNYCLLKGAFYAPLITKSSV